MRLLRSPRALVLAAALLLASALALDLLVYGHGGRKAGMEPGQAPRPRAAFALTAASAVAGPLSATVRWRTTRPAASRLYWGPVGAVPALWSQADAATSSHRAVLDGLAPETRYRVEIEADAPNGEAARTTVSFRTGSLPAGPSGSVSDGRLLVDGAPFFPLIVWQECPDRWGAEVAEGIDLFAGEPCTTLSGLLTTVGSRALVAGTTADPAQAGPVGWFYPDEADGRGLGAADLPSPPGPGLRFLTLTGHFYSGSAPLPQGRGVYPALVEAADVVGFDLYPLQEWCRPDRLADVFDAQRELVALAPGKPTFQWIEVAPMRCPSIPVTPVEIRVESWLAIAAGAHGLGFFPSDWGDTVGAAIHSVAEQIRQLAPALLRPALPVAVAPGGTSVRAGGRSLGGALYVIAVNAGRTPARVTLGQRLLGDRTLHLLGGRTVLHAHDGVVDVALPPLAVRILVAPPR